MFLIGIYEFLQLMQLGQVMVETDRVYSGESFSVAVTDGVDDIDIPFDVCIEWSHEKHTADGVKCQYVLRAVRS